MPEYSLHDGHCPAIADDWCTRLFTHRRTVLTHQRMALYHLSLKQFTKSVKNLILILQQIYFLPSSTSLPQGVSRESVSLRTKRLKYCPAWAVLSGNQSLAPGAALGCFSALWSQTKYWIPLLGCPCQSWGREWSSQHWTMARLNWGPVHIPAM